MKIAPRLEHCIITEQLFSDIYYSSVCLIKTARAVVSQLQRTQRNLQKSVIFPLNSLWFFKQILSHDVWSVIIYSTCDKLKALTASLLQYSSIVPLARRSPPSMTLLIYLRSNTVNQSCVSWPCTTSYYFDCGRRSKNINLKLQNGEKIDVWRFYVLSQTFYGNHREWGSCQNHRPLFSTPNGPVSHLKALPIGEVAEELCHFSWVFGASETPELAES